MKPPAGLPSSIPDQPSGGGAALVLRAALEPYLYLGDPWAVDVALATVVANSANGVPLWVLLVNPPGTGKTELVQLFTHVETCKWLSQVTENTFLSGLQRPKGMNQRRRT